MLGDDGGNENHERAGGASDLDATATEEGDEKSGDNRGEKSLIGGESGGDGKCHGQGESDDADGEPGDKIVPQHGFVVVFESRK